MYDVNNKTDALPRYETKSSSPRQKPGIEPFNKYRMSVSRDYSCCQGSSVVFYSLPIVLEKRHLFQIRNFVNSIVVNSLVCPPVFIQ